MLVFGGGGSTADDSTGGAVGCTESGGSLGSLVALRVPPPWFAPPGRVGFGSALGFGVAGATGATVSSAGCGVTTPSWVAGASSLVVVDPVELPVFTPSPGDESGHHSSTTTINATAAKPAAPT